MSKIIILEIGSWDMDDNSGKVAAHNITDLLSSKPRLSVVIKNDRGDKLYGAVIDAAPTLPEGVIIENISSKSISLMRSCCGIFDSSDFNDTSINRGWIKITQV